MNKRQTINNIKWVISEWGSTTSGELGLESSPCIMSTREGKPGVVALIEGFNYDDVTVVVYQDEIELDEYRVPYEELDENILLEIQQIMDDYDTNMSKIKPV